MLKGKTKYKHTSICRYSF